MCSWPSAAPSMPASPKYGPAMRYSAKSTATSCRALAIVLALLFGTSSGLIWAHEGHAPLPTKGAQVNVEKGLVTLSPEAQKTLGVKTTEVRPSQPDIRILAYASVVAPWQRHAFVTSRSGGRIVALHVSPGQTVARGELLAEVESLELEDLRRELLNAQTEVGLSRQIVESIEPLASQQAIAQREIFEARTKHEENLNALKIARSKLSNLGLTDDVIDGMQRGSAGVARALPVTAPIGGTVIHSDLTVGRVIEPADHLFEIIDLSRVWVKIGVLEKDLHRVEPGQPVELSLAAYPQEIIRTTVQMKVPYLDPQTHLGTVWAELINSSGSEPRFLPGLYGQAQVITSKAGKMLTIPAEALINDGAERYVLVEEEATARSYTYRKQNVVVASQTSTQVFLADGGVFAGDQLVTAGAHELATFFLPGVLRLSPEAERNTGLKLETVRSHEVEDVIDVEGIVEVLPDHRALISTQIAGTLQKISVDRGQTVAAGEVVGEIAGVELQTLQLEYLRGHLQTELLAKQLKRQQSLADTQSLARRQFWETERQHQVAINQRDAARRKLQAVGLSDEQLRHIVDEKQLLKSLPLRAPISGVVVNFEKVLGQALRAQESIFEIQDLSRVWVEGYLSERDLAKIRINQSARVRILADSQFVGQGKVVRSGRVFGQENRTLSVWVELDNTPTIALQQNMLARLTLTVGQAKPTLAIPIAAIVRESTRAYVFAKKADGSFERRLVHLGKSDDRFVEVSSGLKTGEMIAVQGTADLQTAYAAVR